MSDKFSQLFNENRQSIMYNSRPDYGEDIVKEIINFWLNFNSDVTIEKGLNIVDIGCGTGQLTKFMIPYAKLLIGLDSSESQIKQAQLKISDKNFPNYIVGSCYEVPVPNESLDLVTAALCIHWFDIDKFYLEVDRCLKSKGVLAILTYGDRYVIGQGDYQGVDFTELNKFINQDIWFGDEYFGQYLGAEARWCLNGLPGLKFLYPEKGIRNETQKLEFKTTVTGYGNFLRSTSLYQSWKKSHENEKDIIEIICDKMLFYFGYPKDGMEMEFVIRYPVTIILCSKP